MIYLNVLKNKWTWITIAVILVSVSGYLFWKNHNNPDNNYENEVDDEIEDEEATGAVATFTDSEYYNMANAIHELLKGFFDNNDQVLLLLSKLQHNLDWLKLSAAFGIREASAFTYGIDSGNLTQWLYARMPGSDIEDARAILNKINVIF